uniref:Uncharacterized protein n=1 Tax=Arundo donax TaxID=35708 RepID=A0A0A9C2P7_ARUDO
MSMDAHKARPADRMAPTSLRTKVAAACDP